MCWVMTLLNLFVLQLRNALETPQASEFLSISRKLCGKGDMYTPSIYKYTRYETAFSPPPRFGAEVLGKLAVPYL